MPLYEYKCFEGHRFVALQSMKERGSAICPDHGIMTSERVVSLPAKPHSEGSIDGVDFAREIKKDLFRQPTTPSMEDLRSRTTDVLNQTKEAIKAIQGST